MAPRVVSRKMRSRQWWALLLVAAILQSSRSQAQTPLSAPLATEDTAALMLRVTFSAAYDDSAKSYGLISALSRALPPRRAVLVAPKRIDELVIEEYGVSDGPIARAAGDALPKTFAHLSALVRSMNKLAATAQILPQGEIFIPSIPHRAREEPNDALGRNYIPLVLRADVRQRVGEGVNDPAKWFLPKDFALTAGRERPAARYRTLELIVPRSFADSLFLRFRDLGKQARAEIVSTPLTVRLDPQTQEVSPTQHTISAAARTGGSIAGAIAERILGAGRVSDARARVESAPASRRTTPSPARAATGWIAPSESLSTLITRSVARRRVPLLIIDVGWPDTADYTHSRAVLRAIIDSVRRAWALGAPPRRSAEPRFTAPQHTHVKEIAEAIAPLRAVDKGGLVDVLFLPFARVQAADDILREILEVTHLQRIKEGGLQLASEEDKIPPAFKDCKLRPGQPQTFIACAAELKLTDDDRKSAIRTAAEVLARLPDSIRTDADGDVIVRTSSAVLDASWRLLDAFGYPRDTASFISVSWVVEPYRARIVRTPDVYSPVMLVAAAGNEPNRIVNDGLNLLEFGARAGESHVIAVLNMDDKGAATCKSSIVNPAPVRLASTNVLGFDGSLESGVCGTSFSAPRVAWFLALGEALRNGERSPEWAGEVTGRLRCQRDAPSLQGVLLKPMQYLIEKKPACSPPK